MPRPDPFSHAEEILASYRERILPGCPPPPVHLIPERLEAFSAEELLSAVERFAADPWRMEKNAHLGPEWFFGSDERIRTFLALAARARSGYREEPRGSLALLRHYLGRYYPLFYDDQGSRLLGTWGPMGERVGL